MRTLFCKQPVFQVQARQARRWSTTEYSSPPCHLGPEESSSGVCMWILLCQGADQAGRIRL